MSELDRLTTAIISMQKANVPEGVYGVEYDAVLNAARAYRDLLANGLIDAALVTEETG